MTRTERLATIRAAHRRLLAGNRYADRITERVESTTEPPDIDTAAELLRPTVRVRGML